MSFPLVELGSIADFINGFAFKPAHWELNGKPIIRIQNLTNSSKLFNYSSMDVPEKYHVTKGDLLVSWSATLDIFEWHGEDALLNQHIFKVEPNFEKVNKDYLRYALRDAISAMLKFTRGSTLKHVNRGDFLSTKIPLPPLKTQKKIAAVLEKADQLRKDCQQMKQELNSLAQSVFIDMFGDPVTNPKGWNIAPLSSLGKVSGGLSVTSKRSVNPISVPYLRVANVYRDYLKLDEVKDIRVTSKELEKVLLEKGDVLFVEGHGNANEVGRTAVWNNEIAQCVHQNHLIRFRAEKDIRPEYVSAFVNSTSGRRQLLKMSKTTSGLNTLSTSNIKSIQIIVPPLPQQDKYLNFIDCWTKQKNSNSRLSAEFNEQFNALMQKAFKGELNL